MELPAAAFAALLGREVMLRRVHSALPDAPVIAPSRRDFGAVHRLRARTASLLARMAEAVTPSDVDTRPAVSPHCAAM